MRRSLVPLLLSAIILTACASPTRPPAQGGGSGPVAPPAPSTAGTQQVFPDCFPFHSPAAQGPGPSLWGYTLQGAWPLFPGAPIRVVSHNWPVSAHQLKLFLLPRAENAMWYGKRADMAQCLAPHGQLLAELTVAGGHWEWSGTAPAVKPGDNPQLVAVDDRGLYYLQGLELVNDHGVNQPWHLTVAPLHSGLIAAQTAAVQEAVVGESVRITGADLPIPDGPVRLSLGFQGWNGSDDVVLATPQVTGGRLEATVKLPRLVTSDGGESAVLLPAEYFLLLTPPERPFTFWYTTPLRLLPDSQDRATLDAFWRGAANAPKNFPHSAGLAPCRVHPGDGAPDGTCETQISAVDPGHDPAAPGGQDRRTVTLTAAWTDGENPRTHIWSFVVDPQGRIAASKESGDSVNLIQ